MQVGKMEYSFIKLLKIGQRVFDSPEDAVTQSSWPLLSSSKASFLLSILFVYNLPATTAVKSITRWE
jgi:hypothetical protein